MIGVGFRRSCPLCPPVSRSGPSSPGWLPTAIAWAPDGRMFVAEKYGRVRVVRHDRGAGPALDICGHVTTSPTAGCSASPSTATSPTTTSCTSCTCTTRRRSRAPRRTSRLTRVTVGQQTTPPRPRRSCSARHGTAVLPGARRTPSTASRPRASRTRSAPSAPRPTGRCGSAPATRATYNVSTRPRSAPTTSRACAGKIMHIDRNGNGLPGHPSARPTTTSPTSARSSTRRASATPTASSCGRAAA